MRIIMPIVLTLHILTGCVSKQTLDGVATVSAISAALPLIPFAEAYHAVNDTKGKAKTQRERWRQQFDPVYQKRIDAILARDPDADARRAYDENSIAFYPMTYKSNLYVGLIWNQKNTSGEINQAIIDNNELLKYLQILLSNDALHEKEAGYKYHSPTHDSFSAEAFQYKATFNKKMSELSGKHSPLKKLKNPFKTTAD